MKSPLCNSELKLLFTLSKQINETVCLDFQELHAHINGSISAETIEKLIQRKAACANLNNKVSQWETTIRKGDKRSLQE